MTLYEVNDLDYGYPGSGRTVLNNVSFSLERGEVLSILGPNGAGKSTLLSCLIRLLRPDRGTIRLAGQDLSSLRVGEIARLAGFVPQSSAPTFGYSVLEFVLMGRAPLISPFGRPGKEDRLAAAQALEQMGISHLAHRPCTDISGGERQQAAIARAIVRRPQVILFDEPTAHLDFGNQLRTLKIIKQLSREGFTTIITTHNPDHAILLGGRAAILDRSGRLVFGATQEILQEELLSDIYGAQLKVRYVEEVGRRVCLYPDL